MVKKVLVAPSRPGQMKVSPADAVNPLRRHAGKLAPQAHRTAGSQVASAVVGGFRVYGTPARPRHLTPQQIADAIDSLD